MIDIHSHILPGIDDGPSTLEESIQMARMATEDKIEIMIATPHCLNGLYNNWRAQILSMCTEFNGALQRHHIPLSVLPGSEVHLSTEIIEALEKNQLMTLNDTGRYLSLELPNQLIPQSVIRFINQLIKRKITPIISHPERNQAIQNDIELLYNFIMAGALAQITAGSLTGKFGSRALHTSQRIIEYKMIHFMASDAHSTQVRPPKLQAAYKKLTSIAGKSRADSIIFQAPRAVIEGKLLAT
jgi:protein-tyrosine phosphatase